MATEAESLATLRDSLLAQLSALLTAAPLGIDMGENGRSVNVSAAAKTIQDRLDWINLRLAQLSGPFAVTSTGYSWG